MHCIARKQKTKTKQWDTEKQTWYDTEKQALVEKALHDDRLEENVAGVWLSSRVFIESLDLRAAESVVDTVGMYFSHRMVV